MKLNSVHPGLVKINRCTNPEPVFQAVRSEQSQGEGAQTTGHTSLGHQLSQRSHQRQMLTGEAEGSQMRLRNGPNRRAVKINVREKSAFWDPPGLALDSHTVTEKSGFRDDYDY